MSTVWPGILFTVNKDKWPIRREYLSHVTIIMQMAGYQPRSPKPLPSFKHGSYIQHIFINMTPEMVTTVDFLHYFRSGNYQLIYICHLLWPIFRWKSVQKSSLQLGTVLFSNCWRSIGIGVLNYDTFYHREELQNSGKSFHRKLIFVGS